MTEEIRPSRYTVSMGVEGEFEPGSNGTVLRNKLGVTSRDEIDRIEYEALMEVQKRYYRIITPETRFSAALLKRMHKDFLGHIYDWAGRYRSVELEKEGFHWPPAHLIAQNMRSFESGVLTPRTPCVPGPTDQVAEDIAVVHAEFLLIHPFRDGNGRLARLIADLMSLQAGYPPLDFGFERISSARGDYVKAVQAGYAKDYSELKRLIQEAINRSLDSAES